MNVNNINFKKKQEAYRELIADYKKEILYMCYLLRAVGETKLTVTFFIRWILVFEQLDHPQINEVWVAPSGIYEKEDDWEKAYAQLEEVPLHVIDGIYVRLCQEVEKIDDRLKKKSNRLKDEIARIDKLIKGLK